MGNDIGKQLEWREHLEVEKIMVASTLVTCIPENIRLFGLFPDFIRGQAAISDSGCLVLGAAGCYALASD